VAVLALASLSNGFQSMRKEFDVHHTPHEEKREPHARVGGHFTHGVNDGVADPDEAEVELVRGGVVQGVLLGGDHEARVLEGLRHRAAVVDVVRRFVAVPGKAQIIRKRKGRAARIA